MEQDGHTAPLAAVIAALPQPAFLLTAAGDVVRANAGCSQTKGDVASVAEALQARNQQAEKTDLSLDAEVDLPPDTATGPLGVLHWRARADRSSGLLLAYAGPPTPPSAGERHLVEALEALDDGFALFDADDRLIVANAQYRAIYSYSAAAIVPGIRFEDILRHGLAVGQPVYARGRESEWLRERMDQHRRAEGWTERFHNHRWLRAFEKRTATGGRVALRLDIGEIKSEARGKEAAHRLAQERQALLETTLEHVGTGILVSDTDGVLRFCNGTVAQMLGLAPKDLALGQPVSHIPRATERPELAAADLLAEHRDLLAVRPRVTEVRTAGSGRAFEIASTSLPSGGMATTLREITEERRLRTDLQRARWQSEAASRAKSDFLAMLSHEIRTPMNGVLGMTEALAGTTLNEDQRRMLAVIASSGEVLMALLNDMLDLTRIEQGSLPLENASFDLGAVLAPVADAWRQKAEAKGLIFRADLPAAEASFHRGDARRLRQIVENLLSNAIKFTEQGAVTLTVDPSAGGDTVLASVEDTGPGLGAGADGRLFDPFVQGDASRANLSTGSGLGLAICRRLAEAMGGRIEASNAPLRGARFTLELPLPRADHTPMPTAPTSVPALPDGLRILAAEDLETNRFVLTNILDSSAAVTLVANGRDAVQAWEIGAFDVVLMDVRMPVMDGVAATREIRAREARSGRPRVPILALTANVMADQATAYRAAGMDGIVTKPLRKNALFTALGTVLPHAGGATRA